MRLRFAPSPTGSLHLGSARVALINWLCARSMGGEVVLRFDDTDVERSRAELETEIIEGLKWLGLGWDEGPLRQSERIERHLEAIEELKSSGTAHEKDGAIWLKAGDKAVAYDDLLRGKIETPASALKDFVICRSDGRPTYNLATAVDDLDLGITHLLRGEDHISNTALQILIIEALGGVLPQFVHLPLLLGPDGSKLSKRHGAQAVSGYRSEGYLPQAMVNYLALITYTIGEEEVVSVDSLVESFKLESLHRSAARFDTGKLRWLNGQHIRRLGLDKLEKALQPYLGSEASEAELLALQTAGATLTECAEKATLFSDPPEADGDAKEALAAEGARESLEELASALPDGGLDVDGANDLLQSVRAKLKEGGIAPKISMKAVRAALTGTTVGPELHFFLAALPADELKARLTG